MVEKMQHLKDDFFSDTIHLCIVSLFKFLNVLKYFNLQSERNIADANIFFLKDSL